MWATLAETLRRRRAPPEARLAEVGLAKGMKVADIGAGYGYFALPAAEMVGEEGAVYAVEPNTKRAEEISKRAEEMGVKNIKVLASGAEDLAGIPAGEVDVAISMSPFHHFADTRRVLLELRRVVKPGGLVYVRDVKAGRLFKHWSRSEEFRAVISRQFPDVGFEEGPGYIVARIRL
ncbi:MAG TPA: class I SAM-dependent methyltransferase [Nitrososphaerales archaeon]|nr:class I SAM-dependent methyltransferase [Nitrososphaerales archaeon]